MRSRRIVFYCDIVHNGRNGAIWIQCVGVIGDKGASWETSRVWDEFKTLSSIAILLRRLHKLLGESSLATYIALKIRNQCDAVVRARLCDGPDAARNGELLLLAQVAPTAHYFVDVGANVGCWARAFLDAMESGGSGLLFEPSNDTANRAESLLREYAPRFELVRAAVGDVPGEATFFAEPEFGETSSLVRGFSRQNAVAVRVPVTTLDQEFENRAVDYVDFLKVDAEGFDLKVLKGGVRALERGRIGIVQFEYNAPWALAGSTLAEALALLNKCGYTVFLLKRDGLHKLNYARYGEYFSYSNFVAASAQSMAIVAPLICHPL